MEKKMIAYIENLMSFLVWFKRNFGCAHRWAYKERLVICGQVMARHECIICGKSRYISYSEKMYNNDD